MPSISIPNLLVGKQAIVDVTDIEDVGNGSSVDVTEPVTAQPSNSSVATVQADPANNRRFLITGVAAGTCQITFSAPGVSVMNQLTAGVTVVAPTNNSRIEVKAITLL
jgi:hypothetical protein